MGNAGGKNNAPIDSEDYVTVKSYNGETKSGKRHGHGVYVYPNGDIYDGEWRKSKKYGKGVYTFSDGTRLDGYFYKDNYIGETPNEKILKRMQRKQNRYLADNELATEQTDISNNITLDDPADPAVKLKSEGSSRRRAESVKRNKWLRDKYHLSGGTQKSKKNVDNLGVGNSINRAYAQGDKRSGNDIKAEAQERRESKRLRESIRHKYKLK